MNSFFLVLVALSLCSLALADCSSPLCFVASSSSPIRKCKGICDVSECKSRGYVSDEICCSPGVAFSDGCQKRMTDCYVVESKEMKTCTSDPRACLRGSGVFPSMDVCCLASFGSNCTVLPTTTKSCWIIDTYYPARLCKSSSTLCSEEAQAAGVASYPSQDVCCASAFSDGCSAPPPVPCFFVDSYYPDRTCTMSSDIAECNRGWGVYGSNEVCCSKGVGFSDGCSKTSANAVSASSALSPP
jgi:hypothetical protein